MVSAEIIHVTTDAEDSSHCHPLTCINHTTHQGFVYVICSVVCHAVTNHEKISIICFNSAQCKYNQQQLNQQLNQSTIGANYHIKAETKWTPFPRRHIEMHFLE